MDYAVTNCYTCHHTFVSYYDFSFFKIRTLVEEQRSVPSRDWTTYLRIHQLVVLLSLTLFSKATTWYFPLSSSPFSFCFAKDTTHTMRVISLVVAFLPVATYSFSVPKQSSRLSSFALNAEANGSSDEAKKVIVLGGDGFCGWPTSLYLSDQGHDVIIVDNLSRRKIDLDLGCDSLTPISSPEVCR